MQKIRGLIGRQIGRADHEDLQAYLSQYLFGAVTLLLTRQEARMHLAPGSFRIVQSST
jgi:hypothetical protein